jgi:hypothetical protein
MQRRELAVDLQKRLLDCGFRPASWSCVCETGLVALQVAWLAVGIVLAGYFHYVVAVIDQICSFLGISCLTIPDQSKASKAQ